MNLQVLAIFDAPCLAEVDGSEGDEDLERYVRFCRFLVLPAADDENNTNSNANNISILEYEKNLNKIIKLVIILKKKIYLMMKYRNHLKLSMKKVVEL